LLLGCALQYKVINNVSRPSYAIIWMHGLGADASDMMGLVQQLPASKLPLRHIFLNAPVRPVTINAGMSMPAWYDILDVSFAAREDEAGIRASAKLIEHAIEQQISEGLDSQKIMLAGFSQGGAMALFTALNYINPLAGVIALSAYLPLSSQIQIQQPSNLPLFLGSGRFDPIVMPQWTDKTVQWLKHQSFQQLSWHQYDMEHAVCMEEINDIALWLQQIIGERPE
jgi:phospholipase/carboxylesterase